MTCEVALRVIPRAGRTAIAGWRHDAILVRLAAAPVDGAANAALIELVAETLDIPKRAITIVNGASARTKRVRIEGLSRQDVEARLAPRQ